MTYYASLAGRRVTAATVRIPYAGRWVADLDLDDDIALSGAVEVRVGGLVLQGTVDPQFSGGFEFTSRYRVVGGARGWQKLVPRKPYHSDGGVKLSEVARDLAEEVGETLTLGDGVDRSLGVDFVRETAPASRILEQLLAPLVWWVSGDGVTAAGTRATAESSAPYELLDYDPRNRVATVAVAPSEETAIGIGTILRDRLDAPIVVRELELTLTADGRARFRAWAGDTATDRIRRAMQAIARETFPRYDFLAKYRYRVFRMNPGDSRVQLQAVNPDLGLPDLLPLDMWPGMAGLSAALTQGAIAVVEFLEGDPSLPIVTHYQPPGAPGFLPVSLALDATSSIRIGEHASHVIVGADVAPPKPVARKDDPVSIGQLTVAGPPGTTLQFTPAGGIPGPAGPTVTLTATIADGSTLLSSG